MNSNQLNVVDAVVLDIVVEDSVVVLDLVAVEVVAPSNFWKLLVVYEASSLFGFSL